MLNSILMWTGGIVLFTLMVMVGMYIGYYVVYWSRLLWCEAFWFYTFIRWKSNRPDWKRYLVRACREDAEKTLQIDGNTMVRDLLHAMTARELGVTATPHLDKCIATIIRRYYNREEVKDLMEYVTEYKPW